MNIIDLLTEKQKQALVYRKYEAKVHVFNENDFCDCIGIVCKGHLDIVSYLQDGKQIIYNSMQENQIFGGNLIFSSNPYFKGNIIAGCDCIIAFINQKQLIEFLQTNTDFMIEYLKKQADFTKQLNDNIKIMSISNMEERLYYLLKINNGKIKYETISGLAQKLYMQRETLSRLISKLEKQSKIKKENHCIFHI